MSAKNMPDHFRAGSALAEFMAGRLGAPDCWPNDCKIAAAVIRVRPTKQVTVSKSAASPFLMSSDVPSVRG